MRRHPEWAPASSPARTWPTSATGCSPTTSGPTAPATPTGSDPGDPARGAHPHRGRHLRGDDQRPRLPPGARAGDRPGRAASAAPARSSIPTSWPRSCGSSTRRSRPTRTRSPERSPPRPRRPSRPPRPRSARRPRPLPLRFRGRVLVVVVLLGALRRLEVVVAVDRRLALGVDLDAGLVVGRLAHALLGVGDADLAVVAVLGALGGDEHRPEAQQASLDQQPARPPALALAVDVDLLDGPELLPVGVDHVVALPVDVRR